MSILNPSCSRNSSNRKNTRFNSRERLKDALVIRCFFVIGVFYLSNRFNCCAGGIAGTVGGLVVGGLVVGGLVVGGLVVGGLVVGGLVVGAGVLVVAGLETGGLVGIPRINLKNCIRTSITSLSHNFNQESKNLVVNRV